jgi:4-amino-4-deoxy-L-arabinose transferase-like glycosyltransferase
VPKLLTGVRPYLLLTLLCLAFYAPGQTTMPPVDRDEARFAQATRQMVQTGDYVNIRFQDQPRNKKPAGIYWLQAAAVQALGDKNANAMWPYRLPSVVGAILAVLMTFATGALLFDRKIAFLAAALLGSSLLLTVEAHLAKTDAMLLATVMAAIWALARLWKDAQDDLVSGWGPALGFWAALGASVLIKGPVGPMVMLLTAIVIRVTAKETRIFARLRPLAGVPLAALIVAPWVYAITSATGGAFVGDAVKSDLLPKLLSGQESHGFPPGYFIALMTVTFWPGSLFAWHGLVWGWINRKLPAVKFCLAWLVPSWLVFELVPTKLPHYVLPLYPALALLAAWAVFDLVERAPERVTRWDSRIALVAVAVITLLIGIGIAALPIGLELRFDWASLVPLLAAFAAAAFMLRETWRGRVLPAMMAGIAAAALMLGPMWQWVLPGADALWLSRSAERVIERQSASGRALRPVAAAGYHEPSLVFLLGRDTILATPAEAAERMSKDPQVMGLIGKQAEAPFEAALKRHGIEVRALAGLRGFNYAKGKWVTLTLYRVDQRAMALRRVR